MAATVSTVGSVNRTPVPCFPPFGFLLSLPYPQKFIVEDLKWVLLVYIGLWLKLKHFDIYLLFLDLGLFKWMYIYLGASS